MSVPESKPVPGDIVVLVRIPPGLLEGLPQEDQNAIAVIVGKPVLLVEQVRTDPNRRDGDRDSLVGAPLRPVPRSNDSAVALPEPDDDNLEA